MGSTSGFGYVFRTATAPLMVAAWVVGQADLGRMREALANRNPLTESTHPELGLVGLAS